MGILGHEIAETLRLPQRREFTGYGDLYLIDYSSQVYGSMKQHQYKHLR